MDTPIKWLELDEEEAKYRRDLFTDAVGIGSPSVKSVPGGVYMPEKFASMAAEIYDMEVRPDDVWIVTYPKCGTTWMQELLWQVVNGVNLDVNRENKHARSPFLEISALVPGELLPYEKDLPQEVVDAYEGYGDPRLFSNSVGWVKNMPRTTRRLIKTHLPFELLPPNLLDTAKVIFVSRHPRDTCVSFYHHKQTFHDSFHYRGTFEQYEELFRKGQVPWGDYFYMLKSGWSRRKHPNMFFVWYEEMKKDLIDVIRRVSIFVGCHLTELKILQLDDALQVDNFRKRMMDEATLEDDKKNMEKFIRKGQVGDWKNHTRGTANDQQWAEWMAQKSEEFGLPDNVFDRMIHS